MSYHAQAQSLFRTIESGDIAGAFEKFYDDDLVVIEADGTRHEGKTRNRERLQEWVGGIAEHHGMGVEALAADEENALTMAEVWYDVTMKDGTRHKIAETAVQHWEGEHIVEERFYYNMLS